MTLLRIKRFFRFSLGTLLIVVTVLCVWLGLKVRQVEKQKEAVAWVKENLGWVRYNYEYGENGDLIEDASPPVLRVSCAI